MAVNVSSFLLPRNGAKWFVLEDIYLRGGFRIVANLEERNTIHASSKKARMVVITADDGKVWQLQPDMLTWAEFRTKSTYFPFFTHDQVEASDKWSVQHNKDTSYFSYTLFDGEGNQVIPGSVKIVDSNTIEFGFSIPITGHVTLSFAELS